MALKDPNRFIVFKRTDVLELIHGHTEPWFKSTWGRVVKAIEGVRAASGSAPRPDYIVCNQDEPYAERVWQEILRGEDEKAGLPVHDPRKDAMRAVAIALKLHEAIPAELSCTHGDCNELRELAEIQARNQEL